MAKGEAPAGTAATVIGLLAVQALFATLHVVGKLAMVQLSPIALAAARIGLATPILLALAWHHDRLVPPRREWPRLALLGLLGVGANQLLFLAGLARTTATSAAILMTSIPIVTTLAALLLGVERVRGGRLLGIVIAAAGALTVLDPRRLALGSEAAFGNLLCLLNCLFYAFYLVLQRPVLARLPWRTVVAWAFLFGFLMTALFAAPVIAATDWRALPASVWGAIAYIAVFPTVLAYGLNTWAIRRSSPSLAAAFITAQPIGTALLAAAALGERPDLRQGAGFALIAAGLATVIWTERRRRPALDSVPKVLTRP